VCRPKHVEQLRNDGIINSTTQLHLVCSFYEIYIAMHGSMNIKYIIWTFNYYVHELRLSQYRQKEHVPQLQCSTLKDITFPLFWRRDLAVESQGYPRLCFIKLLTYTYSVSYVLKDSNCLYHNCCFVYDKRVSKLTSREHQFMLQTLWLLQYWICHSSFSLSYVMSTASSKASSPHSAI
jgi:hypothetical protein